MSRSIEAMVQRVLDPQARLATPEQDARAPRLSAADVGTRECTCLIVCAHGELARRLIAEFPRFGVRPVLIAEAPTLSKVVRSWRFDAVLIDARRPGPARPILADVLAWRSAVPVMLLANPSEEWKVIVDIERGAADVVPSDASVRLIATKIKRLTQLASEAARACRPQSAVEPPRILRVGPLVLDLPNEHACVDGVPIDLAGRAFAVLAVLAERPNSVVDRTTLALRLGAGKVDRSRAFDIQVAHIRAALATAQVDAVAIETVYRRGYRLALRRSDAADAAAT